MEKIKLSQRLQAVADLVPKGARVADIGSDHAFLPTYLVQNEIIDFSVAGEVIEGPFQIAQNHVNEFNLHNNIYVRLANGLLAIKKEDQIDTVVIAGMGGILISEILEAGKDNLSTVKQIILQPNKHEEVLRLWLSKNNFKIITEKILLENEKFYEIILCEIAQGNLTVLSKKEQIFGPFLSTEKSEIFRKKWEKELDTIDKILTRLPEKRTEKYKEIVEKRQQIMEALA
ncbi:tRNA (adenine(22)-N(1))-methyltransferase [Lactococcus nasutitermitis]|uniref:tRNA (Adenine(22)-N(1))-methyltransferase n=1 Tax=Lactococcus nasutitermitis TaxID=1652957 RepID=A0ABV9JDC4_9LACT|nr:tRNA (adenine(22)-N(1))-methyltransferase TrmK [Lactococcus nasutitermitis]